MAHAAPECYASPVIDDTWYVRPPNVSDRTSAGGIVVRFEQREPLIVLVGEKGYKGPVLPKGGVEPGEDLLEAARREIGEEAGLHELSLVAPLGTLERLTYDRHRWVTTHFFLFTTEQLTGTPTDAAHHQQAPMWRRLDQLGDMFWPCQRKLVLDHAELIRRQVG